MRFKINFTKNTELLTTPINSYLNGFIHKCLGANNKWHDTFSPYSISQMQGGKLINGQIQYPNGGYFMITVDESETEFITALLIGLTTIKDVYIKTMKYDSFRTYSASAKHGYDMPRIECVRLVKDGKSITCHDDNFLEELQNHTIKKLIKCGIEEDVAKTIKLEPFHPEKWRVKHVKLQNNNKTVITPASNIMVIMKGRKVAREKVLSLGFGQSTGCGFGFPKLKEDRQ